MSEIGVAVLAHHPPDEFGRHCELVEQRGFARAWIPDERFLRDVSVQLTAAALRTERTGIGSMVTNPYSRFPALTASLMASVDELARGRLVVGIGAGHSGLASLGIARRHPRRTIRRAVETMRALWSGGTAGGIKLDFTPLRRAIPVWIAARGPLTLQLGGEIGDGVIIGSLASAAVRRYAHANIDKGTALRRGSEPVRALWLHTAIAERAEDAHDAVREIVARLLISSYAVLDDIGVPLPAELRRVLGEEIPRQPKHDLARVVKLLRPEDLAHFTVAGTPAQARERFAEIAQDRIDHLAINPYLSRGQTMGAFLDLLATAARPEA